MREGNVYNHICYIAHKIEKYLELQNIVMGHIFGDKIVLFSFEENVSKTKRGKLRDKD